MVYTTFTVFTREERKVHMVKTMTAAEAAERFQVHRNTVLAWIRNGQLPGSHRSGPYRNSPYRIPVQAVEALETRLSNSASQPTS